MNLFIDTNIFLDFYHFSDEDLDKLTDLKNLIAADKITLLSSEQVENEFYRNREKEIQKTLHHLQKKDFDISLPKICEGYEETKQIRKLISECGQNRKKLLENLQNDIANNSLKADVLIKDIFSSAKKYLIDDEILQKAKRRFDIGNPPGKDKSYGDAINWEILLKNCPAAEDLHFVSGDSDYGSPLNETKLSSFLLDDWHKENTGKIIYYKSLVIFFRSNFPGIKITDEDIKDAKIESFASSESFDTTRARLRILEKIGEFSDAQINRIVKASLENFQIHGAHQYSPEQIGEVLAKLIEGHESAIDNNTYLDFCTCFDIEP